MRSPHDMFFFGMIENGFRGFDEIPDDNDIEDLNAYGVDWDDLHDPDVMAHHAEFNTDQEVNDDDIQNPFTNDGPHKLSHVEVLEPLCPFTADQVVELNAHLALSMYSHSRNMNSRRAVWIDALSFCQELYERVNKMHFFFLGQIAIRRLFRLVFRQRFAPFCDIVSCKKTRMS
ncbi:hypothetical protein B0H14DRAFT_2343737 [Mycena olivaceomarginata]|nr:hypothetical protein B0H14DRAFT_2343737 [Mycena olivaceomarginata]